MSHSSDIKTMEEIFQLGSYLNNIIPASETNATGTGYNNVATVNDLSSLFVPGRHSQLRRKRSRQPLHGLGRRRKR